jgi:GDP/UDP-N,N'-diacetylbacillosamine 2-epimerase (hydrolysing)
MRKVCVVTGTRAEYGLFYPLLQRIRQSPLLQLQLIASTMHLAPEFGNTVDQIEQDGFSVDAKIENLLAADSKAAVAKSTGLALLLLSDALMRLRPDVMVLLGDRFETHAAATTAMLMNIPIAHIHGGELTEGAVDEQIRHSITKMAYLHFTSTGIYQRRVIQMGERPERVFNTGALGVDNIRNMPLLSKRELEEQLAWRFGQPTALFTYHPATLSDSDTRGDIIAILQVLNTSGINILFTYANADEKGRIINREIENFAQQDSIKYKVVKSLGQLRYLSAMRHADLMIGNTSSGLVEAASFQKPVINIGDRQKGRLRNENVLDSTVETLSAALVQALSPSFLQQCRQVKNLYGDGNAAVQIVTILENCSLSCRKSFCDL